MFKKTVFFIIAIIMSFSCVKQKTRFSEPELTPENYHASASKLYAYYYSKHLDNALNRSDEISITKNERSGVRDSRYSRIVVADITQNVGSQTSIRRNQIIAIENYGPKDKTGFNPYDVIMVSKYEYKYSLNTVIHYKIKNGNPEEKAEVDRRPFGTLEANAFLLTTGYLYKRVVANLKKLKGEKLAEFVKDIKKKYIYGTRSEFIIKNATVIDKNLVTEGGGSAGQTQSDFICEVSLSDGKKFRMFLLYPPNTVVKAVKIGKTYSNFIITIDDNLWTEPVNINTVSRSTAGITGIRDKKMLMVTYIRGLDYLANESPDSSGNSGGSQQQDSSGAASSSGQ